MNKKIKTFLDEVCTHINCKVVHKEIREELSGHIDELMKENVNNGYAEEEALDLAISAMGSTDEIGTKLNHQHKPQMEWSILILTGMIAVIGAAVIFLSSKITDGRTIDFSRYIVFAAIGVSTMIALYYFDYTKLKKLSMPIYLSSILLVVVTMLIGTEINGVRKWLSFGGYFSISSPEIASLLFLIAFVGFLERYRGKGAINIIKLTFISAFSAFLFAIMLSISTAFVLGIVYSVVLITAIMRNHFGGNKKNQLRALFVGGAIVVILFLYKVITNSYLLKRLTIYKGKSDPLGMGYQQHMADTWLTLSNWFGKTTYPGGSLSMTMPNATGEYILINVIATLVESSRTYDKN